MQAPTSKALGSESSIILYLISNNSKYIVIHNMTYGWIRQHKSNHAKTAVSAVCHLIPHTSLPRVSLRSLNGSTFQLKWQSTDFKAIHNLNSSLGKEGPDIPWIGSSSEVTIQKLKGDTEFWQGKGDTRDESKHALQHPTAHNNDWICQPVSSEPTHSKCW